MTEQKLLTPEQVAKYAADESQACPFCGGPDDRIDITETTTGHGVQYDHWHCKTCHQSWVDELKLMTVHVYNDKDEDIATPVPGVTPIDLSKMDWELLRKQKAWLCGVINRHDHAEGLVELLDHLMDEAAKTLGEELVFGK